MDTRASFSDFKKWISQNDNLAEFFNIDREEKQGETESYAGVEVIAKVSRKKLLQRIETDDDPEEVVEHFLECGGMINAVDGKMFVIETDEATFRIPRFCVTRREEA